MTLPPEGVTFDPTTRTHRVVLVLDPDQAEAVAAGLGYHDAGARQIDLWADEARQADWLQARGDAE